MTASYSKRERESETSKALLAVEVSLPRPLRMTEKQLPGIVVSFYTHTHTHVHTHTHTHAHAHAHAHTHK